MLALLISALFALLFYARKKRMEDAKKENEATQKAYAAYDPFMSSVIRPVRAQVSFRDVAGIHDVKEELEEIVDFLKNPAKYKRYGIRLPKGVLLVGPPGVGKTMIAKAVAGEASVPVFLPKWCNICTNLCRYGCEESERALFTSQSQCPFHHFYR